MLFPKQDISKNLKLQIQIKDLNDILNDQCIREDIEELTNIFKIAYMYDKGKYDEYTYTHCFYISCNMCYYYVIKYMNNINTKLSLKDYCRHMIILIKMNHRNEEVVNFIKCLLKEIKN